MRQLTPVSWEPVSSSQDASSSQKRVPRIRVKRADVAFPTLSVMYDGPLPCANIMARLYLYSFLVHLDDAHALAWPAARLDAVHAWDDVLAGALLRRVLAPLGHLTALEQGTPTSRTHDAVTALRRYGPTAHTPWDAVREMLVHFPVDVPELAAVAAPVRAAPAPKEDVWAPLPPRQTRHAARMQAAVAALDAGVESEGDMDEDPQPRRRSQRASDMAAKKREAELRAEAEAWQRRAQRRHPRQPTPPPPDDAPPTPLETKWAYLVALCDALQVPQGSAHESPLHRLVQARLDTAAALERTAKQHLVDTEAETQAAMKAYQRSAPSIVSPKYAAWKHERQALQHEHGRRVQRARIELYLAQRRGAPRGGPLGCDADGREYWHLLPVEARAEGLAPEAGVAAPFDGHWSHVLVMHAPGADVWHATSSPADVDALVRALQAPRRRAALSTSARAQEAALVPQLQAVRDYVAWAYETSSAPGGSPGTPAPP